MIFRRNARRICRTCGSQSRLEVLGDVAPTHHGTFHTTEFNLIYCPRCDTVYLDPAPTQNDLQVLYEDSLQFSDEHYTAPGQVEKILEFYTHCLHVHKLLPGNHARVLEVGAGYAWVSRAAKNLEPGSVTVAQDISAECAASCPWVDRYHVGALENMPACAPFDLVSMTHVIEHMTAPLAMLKSVAERLKPGGKLFVTAPFRPSGWRPGQGIAAWKDYSLLHVPAHITYFSRKWFEQAAPRLGMRLMHWNEEHEEGQAFETILERV